MLIQNLGVSCFKIGTKNGNEDVTIVTDPFSADLGKLPRNLEADILTVSRRTHDHHNNVAAAKGDKTFLIDIPGEFEVRGVPIYGIPNSHEAKESPDYHKNVFYHFVIEDMNIVHLGGTREPLTDEQIGELGEVDILFVPVGGGDVLAPDKAADLVSRIEPRVVIPMHYKDAGLSLKAEGVEKFIKASGLKAENVDKLKLFKKDLPQDDTKLYVLARS
jgi:hypothetical protein